MSSSDDIKNIHSALSKHFSCDVPNPYQYEKCFWYYLQIYKMDKENERK